MAKSLILWKNLCIKVCGQAAGRRDGAEARVIFKRCVHTRGRSDITTVKSIYSTKPPTRGGDQGA